jgi:hypothetical protein
MNGREHLKIAKAIARDGVAIGGDDEPNESSLVHSIGRHENGWPELVVFIESAEEMEVADALLLGTARQTVRPGDRIRLENGGEGWIAVPQAPGLKAEKRLHLEDAELYYGQEVSLLLLMPELQLLQVERVAP